VSERAAIKVHSGLKGASGTGKAIALKLAALLGLMALAACRTPMSRGKTAYDDGSYPEALDALTAAHADQAHEEGPERARYALYYGLTHLALGRGAEAQRWLAEAKWLWDSDRSVLGVEDTGRLMSAWEALGHARGEWGAHELARAR
jgi:tetratricopeptide (TPR) repeat protein